MLTSAKNLVSGNRQRFSVKNLFSDFVAELTDLDLTRPIDERTAADLRKVLETYCVFVLRNQRIDYDCLTRFAKVFGLPSACQDITNLNEKNEILDPHSFEARQKKGNNLWHMDMPLLDAPPLGAMLLAQELPPAGGDTQFVDLSHSWQNLPISVKNRLKNAYAIHDLETIRRRMGITDSEELKNDYKPGRHPVICVDPFSGRESLMISAHTRLIEGFSTVENESPLNELFERVTTRAYTHKWQKFDLIFWNNRRTLHRVLPFPSEKERRRLKRIEILGGSRPSKDPVGPLWKRLLQRFNQ